MHNKNHYLAKPINKVNSSAGDLDYTPSKNKPKALNLSISRTNSFASRNSLCS
jgi:hypothetical protein